jgi:hypothetical protein
MNVKRYISGTPAQTTAATMALVSLDQTGGGKALLAAILQRQQELAAKRARECLVVAQGDYREDFRCVHGQELGLEWVFEFLKTVKQERSKT